MRRNNLSTTTQKRAVSMSFVRISYPKVSTHKPRIAIDSVVDTKWTKNAS